MTGPRRGLEPVEYSSRIGGGRSATLVALGICGVLGAVVLVGIAGREPPAVAIAPASARPMAVAETQTSPEPARPQPRPALAGTGQIRPDDSKPRPYQFLGTVLTMGGQGYLADLAETRSGHFYGAYRIGLPRPARTATLELADITATTSHDTWVSLGQWQISLDPIAPETRLADTVLDVVVPPFAGAAHALGRSGFEVTVYAEGRLSFGLLTVEVRRSLERPFPDEDYAVDARLGDFATRVQLAAIEPGHFSGVLVIPDRIMDEYLILTLVAMPAQNPLLGMVAVHEFDVLLPPHGRFETGVGVSWNGGPRPIEPFTPMLRTFGHQFIAQTAYSGFQRAVVLDLQLFGGSDAAARQRSDLEALLVYRDWPLRKLKDDLAALYRSYIDLER